jgi:hypothetical protein
MKRSRLEELVLTGGVVKRHKSGDQVVERLPPTLVVPIKEHHVLGESRLVMIALDPPAEHDVTKPYDNMTSRLVKAIVGERKFIFVDMSLYSAKNKLATLDRQVLFQEMLKSPDHMKDYEVRVEAELDGEASVGNLYPVGYVCGSIAQEAISHSHMWQTAECLSAGLGIYLSTTRIGNKIMLVTGCHPSAGMQARGNKERVELVNRDLSILSLVASTPYGDEDVSCQYVSMIESKLTTREQQHAVNLGSVLQMLVVENDGSGKDSVASYSHLRLLPWHDERLLSEYHRMLSLCDGDIGKVRALMHNCSFSSRLATGSCRSLEALTSYLDNNEALAHRVMRGSAAAHMDDMGTLNAMDEILDSHGLDANQMATFLSGSAAHITKPDFKTSVTAMVDDHGLDSSQLTTLVSRAAPHIAKPEFKSSVIEVADEHDLTTDQLVTFVSGAASHISKPEFKSSAIEVAYEHDLTTEQLVTFVSGAASHLSKTEFKSAVTEMRNNHSLSTSQLTTIVSTASGHIANKEFQSSIAELRDVHGLDNAQMTTVVAGAAAHLIKPEFREAVMDLKQSYDLELSQLVRLVSGAAAHLNKESFVSTLNLIAEEHTFTVGQLVSIGANCPYLVVEDGFVQHMRQTKEQFNLSKDALATLFSSDAARLLGSEDFVKAMVTAKRTYDLSDSRLVTLAAGASKHLLNPLFHKSLQELQEAFELSTDGLVSIATSVAQHVVKPGFVEKAKYIVTKLSVPYTWRLVALVRAVIPQHKKHGDAYLDVLNTMVEEHDFNPAQLVMVLNGSGVATRVHDGMFQSNLKAIASSLGDEVSPLNLARFIGGSGIGKHMQRVNIITSLEHDRVSFGMHDMEDWLRFNSAGGVQSKLLDSKKRTKVMAGIKALTDFNDCNVTDMTRMIVASGIVARLEKHQQLLATIRGYMATLELTRDQFLIHLEIGGSIVTRMHNEKAVTSMVNLVKNTYGITNADFVLYMGGAGALLAIYDKSENIDASIADAVDRLNITNPTNVAKLLSQSVVPRISKLSYRHSLVEFRDFMQWTTSELCNMLSINKSMGTHVVNNSILKESITSLGRTASNELLKNSNITSQLAHTPGKLLSFLLRGKEQEEDISSLMNRLCANECALLWKL